MTVSSWPDTRHKPGEEAVCSPAISNALRSKAVAAPMNRKYDKKGTTKARDASSDLLAQEVHLA
jgi:hypothetical protein